MRRSARAWRAWLGIALLAPAIAAAEERLIDGIAAQVGNDIVLVSEVQALSLPLIERMRQGGASQVEISKARAQSLEQMIEWRLIEKVARQAELNATEEDVDRTIAAIANENGLTPEQLERLRAQLERHRNSDAGGVRPNEGGRERD